MLMSASSTLKWWGALIISTTLTCFIKYVPIGLIFTCIFSTFLILWIEKETNKPWVETMTSSIYSCPECKPEIEIVTIEEPVPVVQTENFQIEAYDPSVFYLQDVRPFE